MIAPALKISLCNLNGATILINGHIQVTISSLAGCRPLHMFAIDTLIDLDLLTLDSGHVVSRFPSELDPLLVHSCIMSYDVLHRVALTITFATTVHVPYHMTYS